MAALLPEVMAPLPPEVLEVLLGAAGQVAICFSGLVCRLPLRSGAGTSIFGQQCHARCSRAVKTRVAPPHDEAASTANRAAADNRAPPRRAPPDQRKRQTSKSTTLGLK